MTKSRLLTAVIDTNLLVSGLLTTRGLPHRLVERLREGAFIPVVSSPLLAEYTAVLARPHLTRQFHVSSAIVDDLLLILTVRARHVTPVAPLPVAVRDPGDIMVLVTALGGQADCLVTGDGDLLALRGHSALGALRIVTAREFLDMVAPGPESRPA
jgi:putative PIN family toxin of toxin-antitoxin system